MNIFPILKNSIISIILSLSGVLLNFILNITITNLTNIETYGFYSYFISWFLILSVLAKGGLDSYALREFPILIKNTDSSIYKNFILLGIIYIVLLSLLCGLLFIIVNVVLGTLTKQLIIILFIFLPAFILKNINEFSARIYQSVNKIIFSKLIMIILYPLFLIITLFVFKYLRLEINLHVLFFAINVAVIFIFGIIFFKSSAFRRINHFNFQSISNMHWIVNSLGFLGISLSYVLLNRINIVIIGLAHDTVSAGLYNVALNLSNFCGVGLLAINFVLTPQISKFKINYDISKLKKLVKNGGRLGFIFTLLSGILLIFIGEFLLSLYGEVYKMAYLIFIILLVGQIIGSLFGSVGSALSVLGYENKVLRAIIFSGAINIILSLVLLKPLGLMGVAIAYVLSVIFWKVYLWKIAINKIKINFFIFH